VNRQYIIRRILIAIPSLLGISVILFGVLAMAPGDPFEELATNPAIPPEIRMALRAKFGLDDPVWQRYLHWLSAMVQGDWGFSFQSRMDVDKLILQRLPVTLIVTASPSGSVTPPMRTGEKSPLAAPSTVSSAVADWTSGGRFAAWTTVMRRMPRLRYPIPSWASMNR